MVAYCHAHSFMTQYVLEILDGDRAGEVVSLSSDRVTIGRKPTNTVAIKDEKASGSHAEIVFEEGRYVLRDLGSTNGTLLDGKKVEEVALATQDVFQVGRIKFKFRSASAEPAVAKGGAAGSDEFKLHKVDAARLARSGKRRGVAGLLVLLLLLAGAGGFLWWRQNLSPESPKHKSQASLRDPANLLKAGADSFDDEAGWDLRAGAVPFALTATAHSGQAGCEATGTKPEAGKPALDFALARLKDSLSLVPGESLEVSAFVRTAGNGKGAVRLRFGSGDPEDPTLLCTGTAPASAAAWTEQRLAIAVPPSLAKVQVELLALLPGEGAAVAFDDVVVKKGGGVKAIELAHQSGRTLLGTGQALTVRAGGKPAVAAVRVATEAGELAGLSAKGLLSVSDLGAATLAATMTDAGFAIEPSGAGLEKATLVLDLPAAVAGPGLLLREGDKPFTATGSSFAETPATEVLLGTGPSRLALRVPAGTKVSCVAAGGAYQLRLSPVGKLELVTALDKERVAARDRLREAKRFEIERDPAAALEQLKAIVEQYPHDEQCLSEAQQMRNKLLGQLGERLAQIDMARGKAEFLSARAALVRIRDRLIALVKEYGEQNLPDRQQVDKMRASIDEKLKQLDEQDAAEEKQNLQTLKDALQKAGMSALSGAVDDYLKRSGK